MKTLSNIVTFIVIALMIIVIFKILFTRNQTTIAPDTKPVVSNNMPITPCAPDCAKPD